LIVVEHLLEFALSAVQRRVDVSLVEVEKFRGLVHVVRRLVEVAVY
jgi:hypothetical protein